MRRRCASLGAEDGRPFRVNIDQGPGLAPVAAPNPSQLLLVSGYAQHPVLRVVLDCTGFGVNVNLIAMQRH